MGFSSAQTKLKRYTLYNRFMPRRTRRPCLISFMRFRFLPVMP
ncbi:hypothetical protein A678_03372 [Salmonella enterica subsp. enterica serovar Enteritidis str. 2010K-0271]|uniref:Uncharacterized protein n=1 Tax=Salmonella enteritidis (strain 2009K0958) TaxID=1192586 RepID=A0A656IQT7_SALE2|nr:hypothetical protein A673_00267 [Salmonella enterica subsp. enterica serovar Enteritidis str. 2009K0958]EPI99144.1 hypothetical protein A678_03372 [Salmonella enterica subsp. enterica serovar Enteritidis str. 2010K-0271]